MGSTTGNNTSGNWVEVTNGLTIYKAMKYNYCDPDETIGYYLDKKDAEKAVKGYIKEKGLTEKGICCNNSKDCDVREITVNALGNQRRV